MEWTDQGIILGTRAHGETSVIAEVMTGQHGRHLGLVRGGRSRSKAASLQPGNLVGVRWYARLEDHLGQFTLDPTDLKAGRIMETRIGIHGLQTLCAALRLLPEREPHEALYSGFHIILDHLASDDQPEVKSTDQALLIAALVIRFELAILEALGFGLDLERCAATGSAQDLVYVSPKSARAVCQSAGEPYHSKLLALPAFLNRQTPNSPNAADLINGFKLTHFFLDRHVYGPRGVKPDPARDSLQRLITNASR